MKTNDMKKGLVASGLSLFMMLTVMAGASLAWFNQTIVNQGARIQSGTLTVEFLSDTDSDFSSGTTDLASTSDPIFQFGTNAQPGDSLQRYLQIKNTGSISMHYDMYFDVVLDTGLGPAIVVEVEKISPVVATQTFTGVSIDNVIRSETASLAQDVVETYRVKLTFDSSAGNEFQNKAFSLDIALVAYQASQSAGDVLSQPVFVSTIAELEAAATNAVKGRSIVFLNSISASSTSLAFTQLVNLSLRGFTLTLNSLSIDSDDFGFMRFENGIMYLVNYTVDTPNATLTHAANLTINAAVESVITVSNNTYVLDGILQTGSLTIGGSTSFEPQVDSQLIVSGTITKALGADITPLSGAFINVPAAQQASITPAAGAQVVVVDPANVVTPSDDIQTKIDAASDGATIYLGPGTYNQTFEIDKELNLFGPNFNVSGTATRKPEAIITAATDTFYNINITSSNVEVAGIRINRNVSATVTSLASSAGHAGIVISRESASPFLFTNNIRLRNNIVDGYFGRAGDNFVFGSIHSRQLLGNETTGTPSFYFTNILIEDNLLSDGGHLHLIGATAIVRRNTISGGRAGMQIQPYSNPNVGGEIYENTITAYRTGIYYNFANKNSAPWTIRDNTILATNVKPGGSDAAAWEAIAFETYATSPEPLPVGQSVTAQAIITGNTFNGVSKGAGRTARGFEFYNINLHGTYVITGNTFLNLDTGFFFDGAIASFSGNLTTIIPANTFTNVTAQSNAP